MLEQSKGSRMPLNSEGEQRERIRSPAIRVGGLIVEGEHHYAAFEWSRECGLLEDEVDYDDLFLGDLGFSTSRGRFVSRRIAFRIARAAGQVNGSPLRRRCELAAEDLSAAD